MTAAADIEALIRRADNERRNVDKDQRADFAGITAMAGLTILAKHVDALTAKIDSLAAARANGPVDVQTELADLRRRFETLATDLEQRDDEVT
jgi:hypothetical protein